MKIPRSLGRYEVVDLIGQGGMGALYRARDPRIGRYVAIKLLRRDFDVPELRDRFSREARAAGGLSHPNIVTIFDVGEDDGLPFIAMEYVRGETFADLVCLRPPLPIMRKLQLTEEVCAGLAHAHEAGIVHRDIKPANLIVGPEGTVKILDFGIAKLSGTGMTVPGAIVGTFNYMSPEQVRGTPVDARADIFSVGAVLYELLSHQPAFPGQDPDEVLHMVLDGVPKPITDFCPDLDPRLVQLVERALEKNPDRRFQNIVSVQKELANIRLNPPGAVRTSPPPPAPPDWTPSPTTHDPTQVRAQRIEEHLIAADRAFDSGDYTSAMELCKDVLMLNASEERAISNIGRIHAALDEQQIQAQLAEARQQLARTTAIRTTIERARAEYEAGNPTAALRGAKDALALDPHNPDAEALAVAAEAAVAEKQEEARIRAAVEEARRRFVSGQHQAALESLEALQPASHALVGSTLEELRLALRKIEEQQRVEKERAERRQRITTLLTDARTALKEHRFDEASQALELVRDIDATDPELADLTERVHRARAAAQLEEDLQRILGDFDAQLMEGELPRAGDLLKAAASLAPTDVRVYSARQRLEQAMAALAAREAAEARRRQGEQRIDDAAARLDNGDFAGAADMLKLAAELVPQHPRAVELSEQLRDAIARQAAAEAAERLRQQVAELIRKASHRAQSAGDNLNDLVLALRDVNQALALDPENADAPGVKTAIEESIAACREAARVRAAINNARSRFANGKHQAALRLLEDYQPPSHPEIAAALGELRGALLEIEEQRRLERERVEREQRVAALLAEARTAVRARQFDTALGVLSKVAEIDAAVPELSQLTERVHQEQAAVLRTAEVGRMLADMDERLTRGELSEAGDLVRAAAAVDPADARVPPARNRLEQAMAAREAAEARARDLEQKHASAEELFERGDLQGAMRLLTLAANLDAQHPRTILLSERVSDAIKKREAADAAERLRQTVDELLAAAAERLRSPDRQAQDVIVAMQKITQALALAPGDVQAQALKATAEDALAAHRDTARIHAAIRNARNRFANGKHQAALQLLENLDATAHPIVADTLKELRTALQAIQAPEPQRDGHATDATDESTDEVDRPSKTPTGQGQEDGAELRLTGAGTPAGIHDVEAVSRSWPWWLIVGVAVLVLAIMAVLFR